MRAQASERICALWRDVQMFCYVLKGRGVACCTCVAWDLVLSFQVVFCFCHKVTTLEVLPLPDDRTSTPRSPGTGQLPNAVELAVHVMITGEAAEVVALPGHGYGEYSPIPAGGSDDVGWTFEVDVVKVE